MSGFKKIKFKILVKSANSMEIVFLKVYG